jgi:hypothetical protein
MVPMAMRALRQGDVVEQRPHQREIVGESIQMRTVLSSSALSNLNLSVSISGQNRSRGLVGLLFSFVVALFPPDQLPMGSPGSSVALMDLGTQFLLRDATRFPWHVSDSLEADGIGY